jgi:imidazolonepropionase-like amidohydrolase
VEVGKKADLLVLRANPLEDIRFLGAIDRVFLDGKPVSRELDPAAFLPLWRTR